MSTLSRIPEKLFFKIGEVCELIKVQPHVLRYWETEFPMLAPQKNRAGQRVYRRKDVEMVLRIRDLLYEEKFTIAGAKKKLADEMRGSTRSRVASKEPPVAEPEEKALASSDPAPSLAASEEASAPRQAEAPAPDSSAPTTTARKELPPQVQRALRVVQRDLEDLLTLLSADASIKR
ncbi:MAG TPA: MerR family transcriptional regulator [Blastocatellia bacterium]|nr:MerR family transcriptional regulator [Blastocatellia bacterium]